MYGEELLLSVISTEVFKFIPGESMLPGAYAKSP